MYSGHVFLYYISYFPSSILYHTQFHLYTGRAKELYSEILKRFLQEARRPIPLIILRTFFCNRKILLLSGSPPHKVNPCLKWAWKHAKYMYRHTTRSTHISNGHENMQSTCIGTPHVLSSGSLHRWHHDTPERVHACHSDSFRLSHNGPFERITTVTTNTPWRLNVWCGETCWGNDSVWRIHFVRVLQSVPQTGHRKTHGTCCTVLL